MLTIDEIKKAWWDEKRGTVVPYQPLQHPAFKDYSALQPCVERFKLIASSIPLYPPKTLLDLGCHTGWFCRVFSKLGWITYGIERYQLELDVASELMKPWNGIPAPIYLLGDMEELELPSADVALCLSTAMYFTKWWGTLSKISKAAPILFMDFGGNLKCDLPFGEINAIAEVLAHTSYTNATLIGYSNFESRPLFKFWQ